jgi:tetratricopeptide (TPR) repeat protein
MIMSYKAYLNASLALALAMSCPVNPVHAQTNDVERVAEAARQAARANRHDDAIAAFRQAMDAAPQRRSEWLIELADQLTWSKRVDEAIALYREATRTENAGIQRDARIGLARALSWAGRHYEAVAEYDKALILDPGNREARLARAEVLVWDGRLGEALAAYEGIGKDHPDEARALRGQGRMLSWRGRHRAAIGKMEMLLAGRPQDREATGILADSLIWMGRPDKAETVLRAQLAADPTDERAESMLDSLEHWQRPEARLDVRSFDQSDDLEILEAALDTRFRFENGRGTFGVRYMQGRFTPGGRPADRITVQRPGVYAGYRLSDALELNGSFSLDVIDTKATGNNRTLPTFEVYATVRPKDRLRFDVGMSRRIFDSEDALRDGLTATQFDASADFQPDELTTLSARASFADYSDGNERRGWQLQVNHRLFDRPRIIVGYRYTGFDFKKPWQRGYYSPDRFQSHELLVQAYGNVTKRLRWDLRLVGGYETEKPGGSKFTVNGGLSLTRTIGRDLEIEAAYDYSSSRTVSDGGFERGIARITVRKKF